MKKLIPSLLVTILLVFASSAHAQPTNGFYVGVKAGFSFFSADNLKAVYPGGSEKATSDTDTVFNFAEFIGYDFFYRTNVPLRLDLEANTFLDAKGDGSLYGNNIYQNFYVNTVMANIYYDFRNSSILTPYIGVGLGVGFINTYFGINDQQFRGTERDITNFAWSLGAGVGINLTENLVLDAGYKFMNLGEVKTGGITDYYTAYNGSYGTTEASYINNIQVGLRYTF